MRIGGRGEPSQVVHRGPTVDEAKVEEAHVAPGGLPRGKALALAFSMKARSGRAQGGLCSPTMLHGAAATPCKTSRKETGCCGAAAAGVSDDAKIGAVPSYIDLLITSNTPTHSPLGCGGGKGGGARGFHAVQH
jgi:hypothetical protein